MKKSLFSKKINWGPALFLVIYQTLFILTFPLYLIYCQVSWEMALTAFVLFFLTGLSITGGYHRYFAHRTYKTNSTMECIILFFASLCGEGSALRWAFDHRQHHAYVDTDLDPYSIKKGFWYAHFLWLFDIPQPISAKVVPDLLKNKRIMWQDRFYPLCFFGSNLLVFLLVGWLLQDYWGAFFLAILCRIFTLHHFTWFINSLAHTWGDKPFSQEQSAVDNYIISLVTFGEGYHNYHHTFANDYRNGIRWYHFDPTKWLLWTLEKIGVVTGVKRMDPFAIKKRMVLEHKDLLRDRLKAVWYVKREELESKIQELSDRMLEKISQFKRLREQYQAYKKSKEKRPLLEQIHSEMKHLRQSLRYDGKEWKALSQAILRLKPLQNT